MAHILRRHLSLRRSDFWLVIIPAIWWLGIHNVRPHVSQLQCGTNPEACTSESVPWPDRVSLGLLSEEAHRYSFVTQNAAGILAMSVPLIAQIIVHRAFWPTAVLSWSTDLVLLLQATLWNGACNETVRIIVQRPRPHVYGDPSISGMNPAHYTSFYSGHTSFAAAASLALVLSLWSMGIRVWALSLWAFVGGMLTFTTGLFRVLGGRHFLSDVILGAIMGSVVTYIIFKFHWKTPQKAEKT